MDPALAELLRGEEAAGDRVVEAIVRLHRPGPVPDVHMVARFGLIATCRVPLGAIRAVREHPNVASLKASRGLGPEPESPGPGSAPDSPAVRQRPAPLQADRRRPAGLAPTGAGVVVGAVDWGMDVAHPDFRAADGSTRLLALWDQRDGSDDQPPDPYGYGVVHTRERIDQALRGSRPYAELGYHPAIADRGNGAHGTHVLDIAAGNGRAGGPCGLAPEADLVFVHMADRNTGGEATLGDSVRLLEAVDFIARVAGTRPWVLNLSVGRCGGQHDGTTLVELALDELLAAAPGRCVVQSTGNYYRARTHASGTLRPGERRVLTFDVAPKDLTSNELEIWYPGDDELAVRVDPPGARGPVVPLGDQADLVVAGRPAGRVYHRAQDPNNGDNHVDAFLLPHAGRWRVTLEARRIHSGQFHAWLERDDMCPPCQARFVTADSACTTGTIANGHLPLVVGAYDAHSPDGPAAVFSSAGPTRDGRGKPDLAAPGVRVLAARSARAGARDGTGELVRKSGTSMATPHVTGAVALCLQADPGLTVREIRALVLDTTRPARHDAAHRFGRGYLDVPRLVAAARARRPAPDTKDSDMDAEFATMPLALAPARAYRELLYQPAGRLAGLLDRIFEVLGRPGQRLADAPRPGDVVLTVTLGRRGGGRCAVVAAPELTRRRTNCEHGTAGWYVTTNSPLANGGDGALRVLDGARVVLPGRLLLRPRAADRVAEIPAEYDVEEQESQAGAPVDAEAAVPPFGEDERKNVVAPLLTGARLTEAVDWNSRAHPAQSSVTLDDVRGALANYVDETAVRTVLGAAATADAVLAERVHQFQMKCYVDSREHDGKAGPSTLDSLGLVERAGFNNAVHVHEIAKAVLSKHEKKLPAGLTAANWFNRMADPSVFGWRTQAGYGLHVTLVRKLRTAERYLRGLPQFKDMTPAELGRTLGITERHAGGRPNLPAQRSLHSFGLAIDIAPTSNPWVHRTSSWVAMRHAAARISGKTLTGGSAPEYFYSLTADPDTGSVRPTGEIWDRVKERSDEFVAYFGLENNAAERARAEITDDHRKLTAGDFGSSRNPNQGFLTHRRELVIALREKACLAWGAVDFGAGAEGSGDIMHFDVRTDSAFQMLMEGTGAHVPKPGRHPCLSGRASEADPESDESDVDDEFADLPAEAVTGPCPDVPVPPASRPRVLRQSSVHSAVREVQRKLNAFHAYRVAAGLPGLADAPLVADCKYGQHTGTAVRSFQKLVFPTSPAEHDGKVGERTWTHLDAVVVGATGSAEVTVESLSFAGPSGVLRWDQVLGLDTTAVDVVVTASGLPAATMPAEVAVELASRPPNGPPGARPLGPPAQWNVPVVGPDPQEPGRMRYHRTWPVPSLGGFLAARSGVQEVATVVRIGGTSDAQFRSVLGATSRGIAVQPSTAGSLTGDEAREVPDATALIRAGGVEVLELTVPARKNWRTGVPVRRLIRNPADVFYYSGHGLSSSGKLVIDTTSTPCGTAGGRYADWIGASDLAPVWPANMDLDVLIIAGCSVLRIDLSTSPPSGPGVAWTRLLRAKGGPLVALLGYQQGAPCDNPNGDAIARAMAARLKAGSTDYARDWLTANGDHNADNAVAIDGRGYWTIDSKTFGGYEILAPRALP